MRPGVRFARLRAEHHQSFPGIAGERHGFCRQRVARAGDRQWKRVERPFRVTYRRSLNDKSRFRSPGNNVLDFDLTQSTTSVSAWPVTRRLMCDHDIPTASTRLSAISTARAIPLPLCAETIPPV